MKRLCIYGKGGIGKSTAAANLAAAFADSGKRTAVVGCDPKADSTRNLMGRKIPTVISRLGDESSEIAFHGYGGITCVEAGGPEPGTGCAGRGIIAALDEIRKKDLFLQHDVVIYDVLGDVVCGGFSMPLRENVAEEVYLVTTSEFMSLYAANNICRGIRKYASMGSVRLAGIIYNERSSLSRPEIVEQFAKRLGSQVIGRIPLSTEISLAEAKKKTVVEYYPESTAADNFRKLAEKIWVHERKCIPTPFSEEELEELCRM